MRTWAPLRTKAVEPACACFNGWLITPKRWSGLQGRGIARWASGLMVLAIYRTSEPDDTSFVSVPIETAETAVAPFAQKAVKRSFANFDGYSMGLGVIEDLVGQLVERRVSQCALRPAGVCGTLHQTCHVPTHCKPRDSLDSSAERLSALRIPAPCAKNSGHVSDAPA
jgi:hypothetical protein